MTLTPDPTIFEVYDLSKMSIGQARRLMKKLIRQRENRPQYFILPYEEPLERQASTYEGLVSTCPYCGSKLIKAMTGEIRCSNNKMKGLTRNIRLKRKLYGEVAEEYTTKAESRFYDDVVRGETLRCDYIQGVDENNYRLHGSIPENDFLERFWRK